MLNALSQVDVTDEYCKTDDTNSPLQGQAPAVRTAILRLNGITVTSLAVDIVDKHTVAYMGTSQGMLLKV